MFQKSWYSFIMSVCIYLWCIHVCAKMCVGVLSPREPVWWQKVVLTVFQCSPLYSLNLLLNLDLIVLAGLTGQQNPYSLTLGLQMHIVASNSTVGSWYPTQFLHRKCFTHWTISSALCNIFTMNILYYFNKLQYMEILFIKFKLYRFTQTY